MTNRIDISIVINSYNFFLFFFCCLRFAGLNIYIFLYFVMCLYCCHSHLWASFYFIKTFIPIKYDCRLNLYRTMSTDRNKAMLNNFFLFSFSSLRRTITLKTPMTADNLNEYEMPSIPPQMLEKRQSDRKKEIKKRKINSM